MRRLVLLATVLATPALAQTLSPPPRNLGMLPKPVPVDGGLVVAPLPSQNLSEDSPVAAFLHAASQALTAGRKAEAIEALERAETRALTRDVRPSTADQPSKQKLVETITAARNAVAAGDDLPARILIDDALRQAGPK
jgi:hypothetical protein